MIKAHQFLSDLEDENRSFSGWDFSFITETGRMQTGLLSWSYGSIARKLEEFPTQRFYDVGALVYYLKAIPWQVLGFNVKQYEDELFHIHTEIQSKGFFDVKEHRFMIQARAI